MKMNWDDRPIIFQQGSFLCQRLGRSSSTSQPYLLTSEPSLDPQVWKHNAGTMKVCECGSQHTQDNPLQESARHMEMSLKDNSGLCYRGKMVSKLHNDQPLWSGSSVGNSTLFYMPETLTPPCVWSKGLLCEGALIKTTAIIVLGAKHLKLITTHNGGGFLATFLIIFPVLLR